MIKLKAKNNNNSNCFERSFKWLLSNPIMYVCNIIYFHKTYVIVSLTNYSFSI
jgi:hypothetical protein